AAHHILEELNKEFEFYKPNHGIAFTTSICSVIGKKSINCENMNLDKGDEETMYHMITTIVDRGKAEEVMNAATRAGSKGGTIINARGSGIHETAKLFAMEIEPEKEIVIILTESHKTEDIVSSIKEELQIDEPGKGIIYIQNVNKTYGLRK
ncbi:MAG: P-II family nitrogen regulator, partial [Parabacteroides sp.]|nr:P-II family nitrogen regulator [Parabacteroides sp.]